MVTAPGRLELLGNHTDYNDGLVMSLAVDKYIIMASSPRTDGKVELVTSAFPGREIFSVNEFKKNPAAPWANYVKGVLEQLHRRGVHFSGFSAAIHGTIPIGAGMSSSAALEVATALTVRKLFPFSLSNNSLKAPPQRDKNGELPPTPQPERLELAKLCRAAENQFVGVNCGILDQISSLFGKAWNVIDIDCDSLAVDHSPMPGEAIIVCNSGVKHELVGGEYNELPPELRECRQKARRQIPSQRGRERRRGEQSETFSARICLRAPHVTTEIARVVAGARALRDDDHLQFGQYMFQSHESSRDYLARTAPRSWTYWLNWPAKPPESSARA